ncbi:MAG: FGGY family carbohydrate kinase [Candidatus Omnitrophica bacterium]|nr:FGGY family carbohydrate kinase [Candidatus Omnitrophota bacterium]
MSLMGVDIGTTGTKAVIFDESGLQLSAAYEEYPLIIPFEGAGELDSERIVLAAYRVIKNAASAVKNTDPVSAVGIASQGEAFTPVASDGSIIGNAMVSSDRRAEPFVKAWDEKFGTDRLYKITGHTAYPMFSLFKLLWIKENQPKVWAEAWKFLFCQDLIAFKLTGETKTDYTMAARSMLFDVTQKHWSVEILDFIGLDIKRLPEVVPSGGRAGTVSHRAAKELGLTNNIPVSMCGHDQPVGALGCGAAAPGFASYAVGTVECVTPAVDRLILSDVLMKNNLASYPHVMPGLYTTVAFNITGGSVLRWVRDNLALEETSEARRNGDDPYERIIASASKKPSDLILLPHFGATGTPHFDLQGVGTLFGLTLSTERSEILRAFLEGITYETKWNISILAEAGFALTELRTIGGGSKSSIWMQIKADIFGLPLTIMKAPESTCAGAAILAGIEAGILEPEAVSSWAKPVRTFEPAQSNVSAYEDRFALYRGIYSSLGAARSMLRKIKEN